MKDLIINILIIEEGREEHIAIHKVTIDEVIEVLNDDYLFISEEQERWLVIGKNKRKKFLTIVVAERKQQNTYGLVTAWPSKKKEHKFYLEHTIQQGGEENYGRKTR